MPETPSLPNPFANLGPDVLRRNSKAAFWGGILSVILGIAAISLPGVFTLGIEVFIGTLLVIGGLVQVFSAFGSIGSKNWLLAGFVGALTAVVGVLFLLNPLKGVVALTALLGIFFLVSGVFRLVAAIQLRGSGKATGFAVVNAVITIVLGGLVLAEWPESSIYILGLFLGIDLIFIGLSLIAVSGAMKQAGKGGE
ncbi:MAG: DUF308 domain-containing protein [Verrucomicrobiota bacterium]